jgi:hypothetical protein
MKVLLNNGRRRLGIPGHPAIILAPGEATPVDDLQIKEMHKNKTVVRWLESETLVLDDAEKIKELQDKPATKKAEKPKRPARPRPPRGKKDEREPQVLPDGLTGKGVELNHLGGGWYEVFVNGFKVTDKNVRKDEAQEIATEYE